MDWKDLKSSMPWINRTIFHLKFYQWLEQEVKAKYKDVQANLSLNQALESAKLQEQSKKQKA